MVKLLTSALLVEVVAVDLVLPLTIVTKLSSHSVSLIVTQVTEDLLLDATNAGKSGSYVVSVIPNVTVNAGVAVTVGAGKTMVIDVLQIGDI